VANAPACRRSVAGGLPDYARDGGSLRKPNSLLNKATRNLYDASGLRILAWLTARGVCVRVPVLPPINRLKISR